MQAIEQSRLLNNLRRDLRSNYKADESLSLLNLSGHEFEVTDTDSNITKIVYPRTVFHTGRPKKSLLIEQKINDETVYSIEIPRSKISGSFKNFYQLSGIYMPSLVSQKSSKISYIIPWIGIPLSCTT